MFDNFSLDPQVNSTFGDETFGSFLDQPFAPCSGPSISATNSDFGGWLDLEGNGLWPAFGDEPQFNFSPAHVDQGAPNFDLGTDPIADLSPATLSEDQASLLDSVLSAPLPTFDAPVVPKTPQGPSSIDSNHYRMRPCYFS